MICFFIIIGCTPQSQVEEDNWCNQALRAQFSSLEEVKTNSNWFKVYVVGEGVFAIAEPYNFQEIISYLILGSERALLFDTGMGMSSIATLAKEITDLPITVLNSHTHYDHIGGNYEFDNVLAMNTDFTLDRAENGLPHEVMKQEVTSGAICLEGLPAFDTTSYHSRPFEIAALIADGSTIELGNRMLEVIAVPGHTPDAIALLDKENGYLWTGDTFYEAPIWLFDSVTDLDNYEQSIRKLADLSAGLQKVFPAHNTPVAHPIRLTELVNAFGEIMDGTKQPLEEEGSEHVDEVALYYEFEHFSFFIRKDVLQLKGVID